MVRGGKGDEMTALCYDILCLVFRFLENDQGTLYFCSLVNKVFNLAASKTLFRKIVISPVFRPILDLRRDTANNVSVPVYHYRSSCLSSGFR